MISTSKAKVAMFLGWALLLYFVLETAIYIGTGRLFYEGKILLNALADVDPAYACYYAVRLLTISVLPLYMITVKKSSILFMVAAFLFIAMGNIYSPFQPLFRKTYIPNYGEATVIPTHFGLYWSLTCLITLGLMNYYSRSEEKGAKRSQSGMKGLRIK